MSYDIAPCPFCPDGGIPYLSCSEWTLKDGTEYTAFVYCRKCGVMVEDKLNWYPTKREAERAVVAKWNTRYCSWCKRLVGGDEDEGTHYYYCSECGHTMAPNGNYCNWCGAEVTNNE